MDLGALLLIFSNSFIQLSIFCCHNPGRICIFPGTLKGVVGVNKARVGEICFFDFESREKNYFEQILTL
jgi:hypothetical protein